MEEAGDDCLESYTQPEETQKWEEEERVSAEPREVPSMQESGRQIIVVVNKAPVVMRGKSKYIFVDVFDYISFDLSKPQGAIVTILNGKPAQFMEELHDGDILEIYWRTL